LLGCGFNQDFGFGSSGILPIHNAYLDVLVGVGLFGTLPVLLGFVHWLKEVWRGIRKLENIPILVPCLGYAVCFLACNCGDLLRYFHTPMLLFGLVVGVSMKVAVLLPEQSQSRSQEGAREGSRKSGRH
jgi:O-antigen ligase